MTEPNPFDIFKESSPLLDMPRDTVDEFLDRINEDIAAGMPEKITGERLEQLVAAYRQEAAQWEIKQREAPAKRTKKPTVEIPKINIFL